MADILLFLSKLVGARKKARFSFLGGVGPCLKLAVLALVLFGWTYLVVGKAVIALQFGSDPSVFIP
jgi:hypothetical protein